MNLSLSVEKVAWGAQDKDTVGLFPALNAENGPQTKIMITAATH